MKTLAALPRVIGISLLLGAIAYAITYMVKPTYETEEVLYFPQASGSSNPIDMLKNGGGGGDAGNVELLNGLLTSPLVSGAPDTASGIVTSHSAIRNCVDTLQLDKAWGVPKNDAYDRLDGWTDAKVDKVGMLDITAKAESPTQACAILKNLEEYLQTRSTEMTVNVSRSNREYLEKRVANAAAEINQIQDQLVSTMKNSPLSDVTDVMKGYFAARDDLQKAQVTEAAEEDRLASLEADSKKLLASNSSFPNNLVTLGSLNSDLKTLTDEIQARQLALTDAMTNFTPNSPEYKSAAAAAKNAQKVSTEVLKAGKAGVDSGMTPALIQARSQLVALKTTTQRFGKILDDYDESALQAPAQYASVERIKLEFDTAMKAYGMLRGQLEMARLAESRDPSRFAVLDEPYPNPKPVGPHRGLIAAVVFLLAGLVQLALMSLKEEVSDPSDNLAGLNGHGRVREVPAEAVTDAPVKAEKRKTPV
jgi:hypothetical protein